MIDSAMASGSDQTVLQHSNRWGQAPPLHDATPDLQNKSHGSDHGGGVHEGGAHQPGDGEWRRSHVTARWPSVIELLLWRTIQLLFWKINRLYLMIELWLLCNFTLIIQSITFRNNKRWMFIIRSQICGLIDFISRSIEN